MPVRLAREAERELAAAESWYATKRHDLGAPFFQAVELGIAEIDRHPIRHPAGKSLVRRLVLARFPYALVYQVRRTEVLILAIMHTSRRPSYWSRRAPKK